MDAKLFSIAVRWGSKARSHGNQWHRKTLTGDESKSRRTYYTNRGGKESLYSKISPLGSPSISVVPELDQWVEKGKRVSVAELQRIIHDLRKRKRFSQALQVSEWMNKKGVCIFTPTEHAVQLDLIGRVHGFPSAETYFNSLGEQYKNDKTYGALLNCYVRQRQTDKSLIHLQKMKEMGFASSPLSYNDMMCLYTNIGQHEKVPDVLREMKENKVSPDNFSYRICINSYGVRSDIGGVERIIKEMESQPHIIMDWNTYAVAANFYMKAGLTDKASDALKKSEEKLDKKDGIGYNFLISLYGKLGNKDDILRLWGLEKGVCKRCINRDYITMLESLARLGEFEEAEKVLEDWELSGNCYDFRVPNAVLSGYNEKGLFEKAEAILKDLKEKGKATNAESWALVAAGYLKKGKRAKAVDCMKVAFSLHAYSKGWKPNSRMIADMLNWLGDKGSLEEAEAFVSSLRAIVPVNKQMYYALLKAGMRGRKNVDGILLSMKSDKIDEDEEIKKIIGTREEKV